MNAPRIIDGKLAAREVLATVRHDVQALALQGFHPRLAVVLVGNDPASRVYVRNKVERCAEVGIGSMEHLLPADIDQSTVLALIAYLNADPLVNGILVQMPLPRQIDEAAVIQAIDPRKDVDGFHRENVGALSLGQSALYPCTPSGCMYLLNQVIGDLSGKHAVVVGRSNIVGKPMAALLLQANCTVTVLHSRSVDAPRLCREADIVIAAVGRPQLINADWLKEGAVVIDVGINRIVDADRTRLVGDVDFVSASQKAAAITPVPGGVGPMTIAFLLQNTVRALRQQLSLTSGTAISAPVLGAHHAL